MKVGVKKPVDIYSEVGEYPMLILHACEIICQLDDIHGCVEEGVLGIMRDTLEVMEYLVENDSKSMQKLYPEYKTIPTKAHWDGRRSAIMRIRRAAIMEVSAYE